MESLESGRILEVRARRSDPVRRPRRRHRHHWADIVERDCDRIGQHHTSLTFRPLSFNVVLTYLLAPASRMSSMDANSRPFNLSTQSTTGERLNPRLLTSHYLHLLPLEGFPSYLCRCTDTLLHLDLVHCSIDRKRACVGDVWRAPCHLAALSTRIVISKEAV